MPAPFTKERTEWNTIPRVWLSEVTSHMSSSKFVTPAEIVLLRQIHGDHAVTNIRPTGTERGDADAIVWGDLR